MQTQSAQQQPRRQRRSRGALVALTAAGLVAGGTSAVVAANPPTGPGNIEIFTKRDMVAIEGYTAQAGQTADITVKRGGSVIGMASGTVDSTGFLEVNHPGGVCWDLVTPNIQGGDEVNVQFTDGSSDGAIAGSAVITSVEKVDMPATEAAGDVEGQVVIEGTYGADVDPARMEVEIVNPDMRDMGIGERAIGWPSDDAPTTYAIDGTAADGKFSVTYGFFSAAERDAAFAGDPAVASWQADAVGVEMQLGLTISEFKEIDGPGFGGCPAGPTGQAANPPTNVFAKADGSGNITATWDYGTVPADAPAMTGYKLIAKDTVLNQEISATVGADATTATLRGLVNGQEYPVEVVALNGQASTPASAGTVMVSDAAPSAPAAPAEAGGVSVKDGAMAGTAEVTWTAAAANGSAVTGYRVDAMAADGTVAAKADAAAGDTSATLAGLTGGTEYGFVVTAISGAGETAAPAVQYTLGSPALTAPTAPNVVRVVPGNGTANVEWQSSTAGNTPITGYRLTATPGTGEAVKVDAAADATSATLSGLTNGTTYTLGLVATSAAGDSAPASFGSNASVTLTPNDQITGTAQYRTDDSEWRVSGSASITTGNSITLRNADGIQIGQPVTVAADGTWTYRGRNSGAPYTATVTATSSAGGEATINVTRRR
ncbi:Fibronectin type III domain-containing protein [Arthrobacter crystallopoietes BAB-32]|uniref:Fibronectin type III domain-containing protein n=1 Tax=Arthrobacter crystallopoietes BAB-32 TaxID=1246476 RepID=N1V4V7_9MICC|nr:fibronectin type III domain-containing protein [Arthrobacter crystallopoietes]EMY33263.1 Fibronectin type III domain-containing protein [Arthrobacter crystallopoietes BAB-32]